MRKTLFDYIGKMAGEKYGLLLTIILLMTMSLKKVFYGVGKCVGRSCVYGGGQY